MERKDWLKTLIPGSKVILQDGFSTDKHVSFYEGEVDKFTDGGFVVKTVGTHGLFKLHKDGTYTDTLTFWIILNPNDDEVKKRVEYYRILDDILHFDFTLLNLEQLQEIEKIMKR